MSTLILILVVFILGIRHGLDADHLAYIDGVARFNWKENSPFARWVGTFFSFGHASVVVVIAIILGTVSRHFTYPSYFDAIGSWVSIISLFLIGTLNLYNLLKTAKNQEYQPSGIKGKMIPKLFRETTNPFVIILTGVFFAAAADTVSQTAVWALAAAHQASFMPVILGFTFMIGMMITDTADSLITYRMINQSGKMGQVASKVMGWIIVALAYGVSLYEMITFFKPSAEVNFEVVGVVIFAIIACCYIILKVKKAQDMSNNSDAAH
ncbi:sodium:proton antiporter [Scopulibacillus cellulosilyticus]|uniref:Nickel/cobalt efflux system n=1 Tax=Scopulibacillus cellulosilyticus TaxID=2665665 RepID=A0ABW2PXW1_9BACL